MSVHTKLGLDIPGLGWRKPADSWECATPYLLKDFCTFRPDLITPDTVVHQVSWL